MRLTSARVQVALVGTLLIGSFMLGGCSSSGTAPSTSASFCTQAKALVGTDLNRLIPMNQYQADQVVSAADIQAAVDAAQRVAKNAPTKAMRDALDSLSSDLQASHGDPTKVWHAINNLVPFYAEYEQQCSSKSTSLQDPKARVQIAHTLLAEQIAEMAVAEAARAGRPAGSVDIGLALVGTSMPKTQVSVTRPLGSIPGRLRVVEFSINTGTGATSQCVLVPDSVGGTASATPCP